LNILCPSLVDIRLVTSENRRRKKKKHRRKKERNHSGKIIISPSAPRCHAG